SVAKADQFFRLHPENGALEAVQGAAVNKWPRADPSRLRRRILRAGPARVIHEARALEELRPFLAGHVAPGESARFGTERVRVPGPQKMAPPDNRTVVAGGV